MNGYVGLVCLGCNQGSELALKLQKQADARRITREEGERVRSCKADESPHPLRTPTSVDVEFSLPEGYLHMRFEVRDRRFTKALKDLIYLENRRLNGYAASTISRCGM